MNVQLAVCAGVLLVAGSAHGANGGALAIDPARVQVTAYEYTLALSRTRVRPRPVAIELVNPGEDDHDLAVRRRAAGTTARRIRTVAPGRHRGLESRLLPGRYTLWCTLANHRARGMRATLLVRS